jgi:preprotein translocase subunit SecG
MYAALLVLHLFICIALIAVVLIQSGKGGGLAGGAFGGSAQTVFGGRGATDFITRATMILGGAFFITSLSLALMSTGATRTPRSLLQTETGRRATAQPGQAPTTGSPTPTSGAPRSGNPPQGTAPAAPSKPPSPPKTGP